MPRRKGKVRWGTLGALAASLGGIVLTVVSDPHVIASASARLGISAAVLGAIVAAVKKSATRAEDER